MAENAYEKPAILSALRHDAHAVLEANAGTGKTHVLAHVFVDLLLSTPCGLEQILAVTFTERATVELRQRVRELLEAAQASGAARGPQGRKLAEALRSFGLAPIYTIHSFCQQVLLEFTSDFAGPQGLEIIDSNRAFHRAFRAFLRGNRAAQGRSRRLLERWMERRNIGALEALLFAAYRQRYLEIGAAADNRAAVLPLLTFNGLKIVAQDYRRAALTASARADALRALDALARLIEANRADAEAFAEQLADCDCSPLLEPRRCPARAGQPSFPSGISPTGKAFLAAASKARAATQIEARAVDAFLPAIAERLERDKREQGLLDYDDMLRRTWHMLDGPRGEEILALLRARLRYGLCDEFQDTDELQWKILRRIFVESRTGNVLYLIGDPKQAIYAFRGADVFTYLAARDELVALSAARISLSENFRSTPAMVDALNAILDQNAQEPLFTGEIQYRAPSKAARLTLRAVDALGAALKPVTLMRYAPEGEAPRSARDARKALGRWFAQNLRRILFDPDYELRLVQGDEAPRKIGAGDIFVLTRTGQESLEAASYLREAGVPFTFYKLDGLLQTDEARDVLDLLKAIESPAIRARRLKAYLTPFFGLKLNQLSLQGEGAPQPLYEMLVTWNALAEQERWAELFDRVLHQSGSVARELLLGASRRRLTNYEQIFAILLGRAHAHRCTLSDLIFALQGYIESGTLSIKPEQNLQPVESARPSVRILTLHKSKGLEAKIVVLFGGFYSLRDDSPIRRYHDGYRSRLAIGKASIDLVKGTLKQESAEEDERLLYVAITRACAKLYLPFFPDGSLSKMLSGFYAALNRRLKAMVSRVELSADLFAVENVRDDESIGSKRASKRSVQPAPWSPPQRLLQDEDARGALLNRLRDLKIRHAPLDVRSYTSLSRYLQDEPRAADLDRRREALHRDEARQDAPELEGSREAGIFLHQAIEELSLRSLAEARDFDSWRTRADVQEAFRRVIRRRRVEEASVEHAMQLVYRALRWPFSAGRGAAASALYTLAGVREMEFLYPISLFADGRAGAGRDQEERQSPYFRGFVDLLFENHGLIYLADWKSDNLASYEPAALENHVERLYELQVKIYVLALVRLLKITKAADYEKRFGGLLYLFLRGLCGEADELARGVYYRRPSWDDIKRYEKELSGAR